MALRILHHDTSVEYHDLLLSQLNRLSRDIDLIRADSLAAIPDSVQVDELDGLIIDENSIHIANDEFVRSLRENGFHGPVIILSDFINQPDREHQRCENDAFAVTLVHCRYDLLIYWLEKLKSEMHLHSRKHEHERKIDDIRKMLTSREYQILELLARGNSNKEIAFELNISERTVVNHVYNLYQKLGVNSRVEAAQILLGSTGTE